MAALALARLLGYISDGLTTVYSCETRSHATAVPRTFLAAKVSRLHHPSAAARPKPENIPSREKFGKKVSEDFISDVDCCTEAQPGKPTTS